MFKETKTFSIEIKNSNLKFHSSKSPSKNSKNKPIDLILKSNPKRALIDNKLIKLSPIMLTIEPKENKIKRLKFKSNFYYNFRLNAL